MASPYGGRPLVKFRPCPKSCIKIVTLCFVSGMRNLFEPERFILDHMIPGDQQESTLAHSTPYSEWLRSRRW